MKKTVLRLSVIVIVITIVFAFTITGCEKNTATETIVTTAKASTVSEAIASSTTITETTVPETTALETTIPETTTIDLDSKIAFWSNRDGNFEIYVMNSDGSEIVRLTDNKALDFNPAWSSDGSKIAFISDRDGKDPGNIYYELR